MTPPKLHWMAFVFHLLCLAPLSAATLTVCNSGCDFSTIQAAVLSASSNDTIRLLMTEAHTEPDIIVDTSVTIEGLVGLNTVVQAAANPNSGAGRVLTVLPGATVTLRDLTLRHGNTDVPGAGIYNLGQLILERVEVRDCDNSSEFGAENHGGGGVFNDAGGTLLARHSRFTTTRATTAATSTM